MLSVTYHRNRYVTYKHTTLNGMLAVIVQSYQLLTYAVGNTPAVNDQEGVETTFFDHLNILVNLSPGLLIALGVNDNGKSGTFIGGTASR